MEDDISPDEFRDKHKGRVPPVRESTAGTDLREPIRRSTREGRGTGGALARAQRISEQMDFTPKKRPIVNEEFFSGGENIEAAPVRWFDHIRIFIF